jgi:signal transduction histidine kinase
MRFSGTRTFSREDRDLIETVAAQGASALERAQSFEREQQARHVAESGEARLRLLTEASGIVAAELDQTVAAERLANLLLPTFADGCGIELLDDSGAIETCAYAHVDPAVVPPSREMRAAFSPADRQKLPSTKAFETSKPVILETSAAWIEALARDAAHRDHLRALTPRYILAVPLFARGRRLGVIFIGRESPDRPFTADEVRWSEDLAQRVAIAFDNVRLHGALQEAVRTRDEFISIVGHELRTPVTAFNIQLSGMGRMLARSPAELVTRLPEKLQVMRRQMTRFSALIDQLVDVYSILSGQLQLFPVVTDLVEVTRDVVSSFESDLRISGSTLAIHAEGPLEGRWDQQRISQVVGSLVSNAIKYGAGSPIELRLGRRHADAFLEVQDHGIGIEPEKQAHIFGRFDRAVSSRNYGGFGLGLWTAKQIVDGHQGRILVQSSVNAGATFTLLLPLNTIPHP